ncbi:MAG: nitrate- and nitrite sensing domain-containing protein, partial [Pseudomonadota bacterium]|nr:nitrate- and nitrite sensing domain-containing protein [Pseudomonadota bacterium]
MRLLSKLKIKSQITLLLIFPLLGLIYFATSIVSEKYLMAQKMDGLTNLIQFSIKVSDIIHEMQRERGVSGLFLENQGDTFATQELSQQRARTDEVIKELDQFLNLINIKDYHQDFQAELAHLDSLKRLEALREAVDTRQISEPQTIENYSKINEGLLDIIIQIASVDTHQDIFRFELAYINLLIAKEKAGLERSLLANAFVQKYFEPGQFKRFCELVAAQQVLLQRVNKLYLDQATGSFLKAKWSGKFIDETQRLRKIAYAATTDGVIENIDPNYWFKMQSGKMDILKEIAEKIANTLHDKAKHIESEVERQFMIVLIVTLIILVLAAIFVFLVSRETTASIRKTVHIAHAIAQGKLDNTIEVQATNEVGELLQAFLSMQTQLRERIEADKRIADEALRVNQALNTVSTSVFITDNHYQIIYANKAAYQLFKDNEFKIRKHLPNFDANSLVGSSIDMFHQNPHYQHQILTRLKTAHKANINIGELNMDLIITPVINAEGEHLGWVSEWNDRTAEVATEKEINHVMLAASQGDFSQRIVLENKTGFFKTLGEVLNQTLDYNQQMVDELMHVFAAIARGDLTQTITHNYAGSLEQLKNDVNATVMTLTNVMTAIQQTADAASQGDFSQRIDIKDKQGFFRALSEVLNHILDYNQQMVEDLMRVFAAIAQG